VWPQRGARVRARAARGRVRSVPPAGSRSVSRDSVREGMICPTSKGAQRADTTERASDADGVAWAGSVLRAGESSRVHLDRLTTEQEHYRKG
jgi:hypothetical protein